MSALVVTGYASLDHVLHLGAGLDANRTTQGRRDPAAWPRAGGCPTYIAGAAVEAGLPSHPVMWVGADAAGEAFRDDLRCAGVATGGVATVEGARSPAAVLAYQPGGACACLFDPGPAGQERLTPAQKALIAGADNLCIAVGPGHLTAEILELRKVGARLYWAVKNDPACFPDAICAILSARADVVFCTAAERGMVGATGAVVVETLGAAGVRLEHAGHSEVIPVEPIDITDTTGAGDTLIGGYIAAAQAGAAPRDAVHTGIASAAAMLKKRQEFRT